MAAAMAHRDPAPLDEPVAAAPADAVGRQLPLLPVLLAHALAIAGTARCVAAAAGVCRGWYGVLRGDVLWNTVLLPALRSGPVNGPALRALRAERPHLAAVESPRRAYVRRAASAAAWRAGRHDMQLLAGAQWY